MRRWLLTALVTTAWLVAGDRAGHGLGTPVHASQEAGVIRARLASGAALPLGSLSAAEERALVRLYEGSGPLWLTPEGRPTRSAADALQLLADAEAHGLQPADYAPALLQAQTARLSATQVSRTELADFDLAMSAATLRYLRDIHLGRIDPRQLGWRLHTPAERHDLAAELRRALAGGRLPELAGSLAPPLPQYQALREALRRYRVLAADARLRERPSLARTLRPGGEAAAGELGALARRLEAFGDLEAGAATPAAYDGALVEAVQHFQARHGLEPDGVIGPATRTALLVPLSWRVRQIELALERLRWLPDLADTRVIALNIPMFHLHAHPGPRRDARPVLDMRAIVGRALRTETPVFVETLREVVFRPYWNVPRSILLGEILPAVARDPTYLARHDMEIVRGAGDDARPVPATAESLALLRQGVLRLRQRPGPANSLGLAKFLFPNADNVYLHGTPAEALFSRARRDFSHGCVRVEDPVALAEWVLQPQPGWTRERIVAAMTAGGPHNVLVADPVQVVLFYITAAVDPEDGTLHFADDIYRHDAPLDRALAAARRPAPAE